MLSGKIIATNKISRRVKLEPDISGISYPKRFPEII